MSAPADDTATHIADYLAMLGQDELEVVLFVVEGLARGRAVYGELDVASDRRDYRREAGEEVRDALVYLGAELVRLRRSRQP